MKVFTLTDPEVESAEKAKQQRGTPKGMFRLEYFGDLRLLGLGVGLVLLCLLGFMLQQQRGPEPESPASIEQSAILAASANQNEADETTAVETSFAEGKYFGSEHVKATAPVIPKRTPEEHKRLMREMAQNIPEGETLIY